MCTGMDRNTYHSLGGAKGGRGVGNQAGTGGAREGHRMVGGGDPEWLEFMDTSL